MTKTLDDKLCKHATVKELLDRALKLRTETGCMTEFFGIVAAMSSIAQCYTSLDPVAREMAMRVIDKMTDDAPLDYLVEHLKALEEREAGAVVN